MKTTLATRSILLLLAIVTHVYSQSLPNLSTLTNVPGASLTDSTSKVTKTSIHSSSKDGQGKTTSAASVKSSSSAASDFTSAASSTSSFVGGLTGAPTLAGVGIPSLVIPNTANAPFMQKSNLPEGTIFICVGAALAFLFLSVLAWRGLVAWSLHRSVKRVAATQYVSDKKIRYQPSATYSTTNLSLENLTALNTSTYAQSRQPAKKPSRQNTPDASLFFSPTAGATGIHGTNNRSSTYLPAGYYASGASAPAAGAAIAHLGGGPSAAGYGRLSSSHGRMPSSPPDSPHVYPSDRPGDRGSSYSVNKMGPTGPNRSSASLGVSSQQRTPSACLEDLFENHGNGPRERF